MYTTSPDEDCRSSMTVAASLGTAGGLLPVRISRAESARSPLILTEAAFAVSSATNNLLPRSLVPELSARRSAVADGPLVADLDDQLYLHRRVQRQHGRADSTAGMAAGFTEYLEQQFARAVDDLRLAGEIGRAGDEAGQLDDPTDGGKPACGRGGSGQRVERARARQGSALRCADFRAALAASHQITVPNRKPSSGVGQRT